MVDFSFLEYSFDPSVADREKIHSSLNRLGFVHRTQHRSDTVGFWVQNQCIILLREDANGSEPHISGLGFIAPPHIIENDDIYFDQQSNIYITVDPMTGKKTVQTLSDTSARTDQSPISAPMPSK